MAEVLIATLGTEAQIVTLSLLELARLGFKDIQAVVVIHTASENEYIQEALNRLRAAFASEDWLQRYRFRLEVLHGPRAPLTDITTAEEAQATFNEIYHIVRRYKLDGYRIHLNIAGGRKPMSIYGMVTAQILFDEGDHLWHIVSNKQLVGSRRLTPIAGDEYTLVPIPVIQATDRPDLAIKAQTAEEALQAQALQRSDMHYTTFLGDLTEAEKGVLKLMLAGYINQQIADELHNRPSTITKHINHINQKWRARFGDISRAAIRATITTEMHDYFTRHSEEI